MAKGSGSTKGGVDGHSYSKVITDIESRKKMISDLRKKAFEVLNSLTGSDYTEEMYNAQHELISAIDNKLSVISDIDYMEKNEAAKALKDTDKAMRNADKVFTDLLRKFDEGKKETIGEGKKETIGEGKKETIGELKSRLGTEIPKTLTNLDKVIDKKSKSVKYTKEEAAIVESNLKTLFDNSDFGMNVPFYSEKGKVNIVDSLFADGYFKSSLEVKESDRTGAISDEYRKDSSKNLFGIPTDSSPESYEKYGFLMDKDVLKQAKSGIADLYWAGGNGIQIRFKKDRVITTFTAGDSLIGVEDYGICGSLTSDPKAVSISNAGELKNTYLKGFNGMSAVGATKKITKDLNTGYIELQYHGKLTTSDIESIYVKKENVKKISDKSYAKMKELGIKVYTTDDSGKLITIND